MSKIVLRSPLLQLTALSFTTAGLIALSMPRAEASYIRVRTVDYQTCTANLLGAGIAEADATSACAAALYPLDVSRCVTRIKDSTEIVATDALSGCRRVRRPVELATCVTDISAGTNSPVLADVLDNCRRSLLPTRYSACVVGITRESTLAPAAAMQTCSAAGDRPRNVLPNFIPTGSEPEPAVRFTPLNPETTPLTPNGVMQQ